MTKGFILLLIAGAGLPCGCALSPHCASTTANEQSASYSPVGRHAARFAVTAPGLAPLQLTAEKESFVYRSGENLRFGVSVFEDSYVECFYRRANGVIFKVYPNRFQQAGELKAGSRVTFPNPVFFPMQAGQTGQHETLLCMGSARAFGDPVRVDFNALAFAGLSDVVNRYRAAHTGDIVVQTLAIEVRP